MPLKLIILSLLVGALGLFAGEKEAAFEKAFVAAIETSDAAMYGLVEFGEGTNPLFDKMLKDSLKEDRMKKIESFSFSSLEEGQISEFEYEGVCYISTLPIEVAFTITYEKTKEQAQVTSTTYRLGTKEGVYKIVGSKPKEVPATSGD